MPARPRGGPATPLGRILSGAVLIIVGSFPLFLLSGGIITGFLPANNVGILMMLAVFGLIFVAGIYNILRGVRMRKATKLSSLNQQV
jgi:hypothetical protein